MLRPSPGGPCPRRESNPVSDLRKVVCASVTPRGLRSKRGRSRAPHPGIEPGLAASKAAVRPPHPRGNSRVPSPGVEPGLRPSESRVPSVTRRGRDRSRRPESNRHEPAYKATQGRPANSTKSPVILGLRPRKTTPGSVSEVAPVPGRPRLTQYALRTFATPWCVTSETDHGGPAQDLSCLGRPAERPRPGL